MLISIIIFIFTLLILVIIHEFGHFLMAKRFGIKVEEFGFGIPPRLWGKKISGTIFSLNAIPLGGFVRLLGEDEVNKKVLENKRSFARKTPWQRILVVIAGISMNLILAWILFYIVIIGQNFRIIAPTTENGIYITKTEAGFPAAMAGIEVGDKLLSVDGKKASDFEQARNLIKDKGESIVVLKLQEKGGQEKTVEVVPKRVGNDTLIGVVFAPFLIKEYKTSVEKIFSGITYSWDLTRLTFIGLGKTITDTFYGQFGKVSQQVSGPVGIASMSTNILSGGWQASLVYIWFVGVLSLTLSIFNVLPIPALDGGRLFFLIIEAIFKKKVGAEVERAIHSIGFAILLTLALLVTYSDISKIIK